MYTCFFVGPSPEHLIICVPCNHSLSIKGRVAQSVERWSNKPLVKGSSPFVTTSFVQTSFRTLDVAFVAERLRRYVQVVVLFEGVGSSPTECNIFFFGLTARFVLVELVDLLSTFHRARSECNWTPETKISRIWRVENPNKPESKKKIDGGTGIRARVERITTANANHYTIPPRMVQCGKSE